MTSTIRPAVSSDTNDRSSRLGRIVRAAAMFGLVSVGAIGVGASYVDAAGVTGLHYRASATCNGISSPVVAAQNTIRVATPIIYAANTTSGLDGQFVSFRHRLVKWNNSSWVAAGSTAVWSGFATDARPGTAYSSGAQTINSPVFTFTAPGKGFYAVVTDYWWPGGSNVANAQHAPSSNNTYCSFSY